MSNLKLTFVAILLASFIFPLPGSALTRKQGPLNRISTFHLAGGDAVTIQSDEKKKAPTVAILLFDRVEIIDFAGPWEVFGGAGYNVFTVAEKLDPVNTVYGQKIVADYTFENSPNADVLLVPGGGVGGAVANSKLISWVQEKAKSSTYVMSVCTGAFILAKADLLNGLTATTVRGGIDRLATSFPNVKVVYDKRYVDNGKIITTAGLSSGIDGAFYLVAKMLGKGQAQQTALGLEYKWDPEAKFARAAYADRYLPNFQGLDGTIVSVDGDTESWNLKALISKPASLAEIVDLTKQQILSKTPHVSSKVVAESHDRKNPDRSEIIWKFNDDLGRPWAGLIVVEPSTEEKGKFILTSHLARPK